jgi:hypothetical protein
MDIQEVEWRHGLDPAGSGWRPVVGTCECGNHGILPKLVPYNIYIKISQ